MNKTKVRHQCVRLAAFIYSIFVCSCSEITQQRH